MITKRTWIPYVGSSPFSDGSSASAIARRGLPFALEAVDPYKEKIPITFQKESYDIKLQIAHH